ncbi:MULTISPECIES: YjaA family stress response protein [Photorhabdus]|uniref:Photorhabdus luminescens subsp. laumondii TTO1 complete genome segment 12/17 n=1 Tax=Photorhabdus laumondii subsp. laumondii (strain DSM 15139 / CIP 105565 / TT01) TaxID=243265 RepID=Q7N1Q5_PHOLL|nr:MULTISPECIES: YjaA family stress response protein [Photorhabdus]AXG48396.1 hypothetical protein PluTT01m_17565 [Photorhabdus laumondii subsp. laumondii]MBS9443008.1 hypothetical protein [Photorhabdus heterorhabditis]NHB63342.1 hypothetical protein [Photorhabdus sp. RW14-46]CAE15790.1 unnamed protein product [Photorhabdus laumondii subsp. laumondii TTO1]
MSLIYIRLYINKIVVRNVSTGKEVSGTPDTPFTTSRLLLGQMIPAMFLLKKLIKKVRKNTWYNFFLSNHHVIIQPMEMNEGGHSQVEFRAYIDLAKSITSSQKVNLCSPRSQPLSDNEIRQILSSNSLFRHNN